MIEKSHSMKSTLRSKLPWLALALVFAFVAAAPELYAQAEPGAAPADAAPAEGGETTLWDKIADAGPFMYPIFALSVALITLAVYNGMQLTRKKFVPADLRMSVQGLMEEVRVRSAIEHAAESPTYFGRMMATALPYVDATDPESLGRTKVEDAIADFAIKENPAYMSWIGYFSVISQVAPMIGLFGTVVGMILAFDTMGISGGSDPAALASNISLALMTTAGGLVVAVPAIFCFYIFKNKFNKLVTEAQDAYEGAMDAAIATVNADQQLAKVPEGIAEG